MQSMQRQFGKLLHKSPGDNARVAVLLNDYEDADRLLVKVRTKKKTAITPTLEFRHDPDTPDTDKLTSPDH